MNEFQVHPEQASTIAGKVDNLYFFLVAMTLFFVVLIFTLIFVFAVKYRRRHPDQLATQTEGSIPLEIFWSAVPLVVVMGIFVWSANIYFMHASPPKRTYDVYVVGKQWMWKIQHPGGRSEINELHVPVGQAVKLIMTSQDVIHSFYLPVFRIKQDVLPGRYTTQWFEATKPGKYHIFCAEYCGTNHSRMIGQVTVMEPAEFQQWLSGAPAGPTMVQAGEQLFTSLGCASCHVRDCPPLQNLFGRTQSLEDGRTVRVDEAYIRESIVNPTAKIVRGYKPIMPTFEGQVTEEGVLQLIAYIKSLSNVQQAPGGGAVQSAPPAGGKQ